MTAISLRILLGLIESIPSNNWCHLHPRANLTNWRAFLDTFLMGKISIGRALWIFTLPAESVRISDARTYRDPLPRGC